MKHIHRLAALATLAAITAAVQPLGAQSPMPSLTWGPAPAIFPAGARMAVLQGNPGTSGEYTVRLEMPNGYTIAPHYHPTDEHITVIEGTFLVGMGDSVQVKSTMRMEKGDFATAPAGKHHYAMARGRTIVQVHGTGPFVLTYVNPKDDPSRTAAK